MIKGFIFDLDGTLADTIDDIGWAVNRMLSSHGFPLLERKDHLANINNGAFQLIRRSLPEEHRESEDFVRSCLSEYEAKYAEHYIIDTYAYAGIPEILCKLSHAGYSLAVLSNKQDKFVKDIVSELFPNIPFAEARGQTELPTKPNPTSALVLAEKMNLAPKEIAFVGDSQVDIRTAINAGMYPVGVTWGYRPKELLVAEGARLTVDTPDQLINLLAKGDS